MKTPQKLGLAALGLFTISHCLPAYSTGVGFACFMACYETLVKRDANLGGWVYYSGFVFSNILFVILVLGLLLTKKMRRLRLLVTLLLTLHVISWSAINLIGGDGSGIHEIKLGYYVWLLAYALLFAAHIIREPSKPLEPTAGAAVAQL